MNIYSHAFIFIGGTWVAGMAASGAYLWAQRYLTWQQKLVQARMYAQSITIAALLATAFISASDMTTYEHVPMKDDSWRNRIKLVENNAVPASQH
jgi:hypothetical protein